MRTFKMALIKEIWEGIRQYKFLIASAGILFFALMDPVMLKMMPVILKSQFKGMDITDLLELSQREAVRMFINDAFQIATLVAVLGLMGITAVEISSKTLVVPYCSGMPLCKTILAKILVYGFLVFIVSILAAEISFHYAGILFPHDPISPSAVLRVGCLMGLYFVFVVAALIFTGTLFKKQGAAAFITLLLAYLMQPVANFFKIVEYTPMGLIREAQLLAVHPSKDMWLSAISTTACIIVFIILSVERLKHLEFA